MVDMKSEREVSKEEAKSVSFAESFHDLSKELAGAYSVSPDIYSQSASTSRFEEGISVNQAKEFLGHVVYDSDKAGEIIKDFAKSHKPIQFYSGKDIPINLGVNIGSEELLSLSPDSKANGRSATIAVLAQKAARLESLLTPNGIPDVYATAQRQAKKASKVIERAASLAYDWNPGWGRLSVDNALGQAGSALTRQKISRATIAGVFALAGCNTIISPTIPDITGQGTSPITTEVVPAFTDTLSPTETVNVTPTEAVKKPTVLDSLSKDFYMKDSTSLWYKSPTSGKSVPVLVNLNSTEGTFQYALDGGKNTEGPEGGRETVRYVDYDHLYAFSESVLVGVSNWDHRVFTFDTRSMWWREGLGGEAVAEYVDNADGVRTIMVWRKDLSGQMVEVDSGYRIDSSDALIQVPSLANR